MIQDESPQAIQAVLFDYGDTLAHFGPVEQALPTAYEAIREKLIAAGKKVLLNGALEVPAAHLLIEGISVRFWQVLNRSYEEQRIEELDAGTLFRSSLEALDIRVDDTLLEEIILIEEGVGYTLQQRASEVEDVAAALRARGLKLGLVSNYCSLPSIIRHYPTEYGLLPLVDEAIFSCELGLRKPHPAIYQDVLERLDVAPQHAVFIGDRLREDVMGPKALGMRAVLTHQFRQEDPSTSPVPPDAVIARLAELPLLVERWMQEAGD
jgi:HAD superfamily hydrolase (TIGR01549 family)